MATTSPWLLMIWFARSRPPAPRERRRSPRGCRWRPAASEACRTGSRGRTMTPRVRSRRNSARPSSPVSKVRKLHEARQHGVAPLARGRRRRGPSRCGSAPATAARGRRRRGRRVAAARATALVQNASRTTRRASTTSGATRRRSRRAGRPSPWILENVRVTTTGAPRRTSSTPSGYSGSSAYSKYASSSTSRTPRGQRGHERLDLASPVPGPGGVVRVGHEDEAGARSSTARAMASRSWRPVAHGDQAGPAVAGIHDLPEAGEGLLRDDGVVPGTQEGPDDQVDDVHRPVPDDHLGRRHPELRAPGPHAGRSPAASG